jgi:hypothetical protein
LGTLTLMTIRLGLLSLCMVVMAVVFLLKLH